jgi:sugar/nucleoside kinase (ribokinase family)
MDQDNIFAGAIRMLLGDSEESSEVDPEDLPKDVNTMTEEPVRCFVAFGEVFLKYRQSGELFTKQLFSSELDLLLSLSKLGNYCEYFTIIPSGHYGETIRSICRDSRIDLRYLSGEPGSHIGDMTRMTDGTVIHQRQFSAFHLAEHAFPWDKGVLSDRVPCWVHSCLSSMVWSNYAMDSWRLFMAAAVDDKRSVGDVCISLDLRLIDSDMSLRSMWKYIEPFMNRITILFLTREEFFEISGNGKITEENVALYRSRLGCECLVVIAGDYEIIVTHSVGSAVTLVSSETSELQKARLIHRYMHFGKRIEKGHEWNSILETMNELDSDRILNNKDLDTREELESKENRTENLRELIKEFS